MKQKDKLSAARLRHTREVPSLTFLTIINRFDWLPAFFALYPLRGVSGVALGIVFNFLARKLHVLIAKTSTGLGPKCSWVIFWISYPRYGTE